MRIAILMDIGSPWTREVALLIKSFGHEVHVIDFAVTKDTERYITRSDEFQVNDVAEFSSRVDGVHFLFTRWKGNLRYIMSSRRLWRLMGEVALDILLTLYGGGNAIMAWLSGFRPYSTWVLVPCSLSGSGLEWSMAQVIGPRFRYRCFASK